MKHNTYRWMVLLWVLIHSTLSFAYDVEVDGIYYNLDSSSKTAEVTSGTNEYSGNVVIPATINSNGTTYNVTSIGNYAFAACSLLSSVNIPNSVTSIGDYAFEGCSSLTSVDIPNSVTSIGNYAFSECGLTSLTIGNSVTSIGNYAFAACSRLPTMNIPNSVTSIGYHAFDCCSGLTSLTIGNNVTSIGTAAFFGCSRLTAVIIPNSVKHMGNSVFSHCDSLISVTISKNVTSIGDYTFSTCSRLTSVIIPNSVISIGEFAYYGCSRLTSITIPNSVTSIGGSAFYKCSGLTSATIGNSVTNIGNSAFSNCFNINFVKSEIESPFNISTSVFNGISSDATLQVPKGTKSKYQEFGGWTTYFKDIIEEEETTTYTLSITASGNGSASFNGTTIMGRTQSFTVDEGTSATITFTPDNGYRVASVKVNNTDVTSSVSNNKYTISNIKANTTMEVAFGEEINTVTIDNITYNLNHNEKTAEVTSGKNEYIGNVVIPATINNNGTTYSVTSIGDYAFSSCSGLTSVTIPNSVTIIDGSAFYKCSGLISVTFGNSVTSIGGSAFYGCSGLTSITIPNSVTSIGWAAFQYCSGLNAVHISDLEAWCKISFSNDYSNPLNYAHYLFLNDTEVKDLKIPNSVTSIGKYAFCGCSSLTSVTIPSVTYIGIEAFHNCSGLKSLTIPKSITNIDRDAFKGCSVLTAVHISDLATWCNISFYNSNSNPLSQAHHLFMNDTEVKDLKIPNSVTSIGKFAFCGCSSLTSVTIPNSAKSIGFDAFDSCSGLTSVTIPNSVTSIDNYAFQNCSNMSFVKSEIESPFIISENVFNGISSNATLQIPKGTKSKYQEFSGWTTHFKYIIEEGGTTTYTLSITASGNGSATYNNTSVRAKTQSFDVDEGTSATVSFAPDSGYRIASVKLNNTDVTSSVSNNKYTISNITANTTLSVTFEAIPVTTYTLNITASGNGSATYNSTTIRSKTQSFDVEEGTSATVTFSPDSGYRIASVKLNNTDVTSSVSNNQYTISNITANTTLSVTFEDIPPTTYTLSITASGNGSATYNSTTIKNKTQSFTVNEGANATVTFSPDSGYRIASVKVNNTDVTSSVSNNKYTISNITANTTLSVAFEEEATALTVDGVNYSVISQTEKTVKVATGNYGQVLTVPATVTQNGKTWTVMGIGNDALKDCKELAAVIWNPSAAFTAAVSNPNLLLYVKSEEYAPAAIKNVVVNGTANSITLTEAASGNNFYCPQAFTARNISYTHRYSMTTGIGESRGWETLALPFDVQSISHETKGDITPFANRKSGDANKPFWLYELTGSGFVEAANIKAYTPYIISMPNNAQYDSQWLLSGSVTFAASNVTVSKTEDVNTVTYRDRTFVPNFVDRGEAEKLYALNVNNDYTTNESGMTEGSKFVLNMRTVHPFEAYMTTASNARQVIDVFEDMTTDIRMLGIWEQCGGDDGAVYDLQGRQVSHMTKGVYVGKKGQKYIIK